MEERGDTCFVSISAYYFTCLEMPYKNTPFRRDARSPSLLKVMKHYLVLFWRVGA
jgi:hypothetical protein